ncbi:MAG TPA: iron-sulfur cluster carrier protein MrpORP [Thermoanaerobaculaceae bacterium]|nr:iron-sulfur cluster carrier protein MrpORP [Thermoanaerobaculaceae bacterium]HRS17027.1 iron-sulfur cluster carrier protein MrpORP [Thermoanaerobaculaceae bacterium]
MEAEFVPSPALIDHAQNPRNLGAPQRADGYSRITGQCGDTMEIWLCCRGERIVEARFVTTGCGPSLASGSAVTELARGLPLDEALAIGPGEVLRTLGGLPEESRHCASLAAETLHAACLDALRGGEGVRAEQARLAAERAVEQERLRARVAAIRHQVVVLSGKGGVGKSTVAVSLAAAAARAGLAVGLLDVDVHGPSVPTMAGIQGQRPLVVGEALAPVEVGGVKVMSVGLLLGDQDQALIWRGPMKAKVIEQLLRDVAWGELDLLVVDAPPGTGDEPLAVCQLLGRPDGAVIVTTPQDVAITAVRKSITFCRQLGMPVLGVVENMSGMLCPACGHLAEVFGSGAGEIMASEMGVPFLGRIPMHPEIAAAGDAGALLRAPWASDPLADAFSHAFTPVLALAGAVPPEPESPTPKRETEQAMRIAIPLADGRLAQHFGHCAAFALLDVDLDQRKILARQDVPAPDHQPGLLPPWLAERGAKIILAGGMGSRAQQLFAQHGIQVIVGVPSETPEALVTAWMAGTLVSGENVCDH